MLTRVRLFLRKTVDRLQYRKKPDVERIGSIGAAWSVRVMQLKRVQKPILFSGGAGNDITFEKEFAERFGGEVFLYDPSPTGLKTIEGNLPISNLHFIPKALAGQSGVLLMDRPNNPQEGSWTVNGINNSQETDSFESVSLVQEIRSKGYIQIDVLKLDIEGFEYAVLEDLLNSSIQVDQILVEFHDFYPSITRKQSRHMRELLRKKGYQCFFKHRYDYSFYKI